MKLLKIFKTPTSIRNNVIKHYLNKIVGKKSSDELMGAKNLFKLYKLLPALQIMLENTGYMLRVQSVNPPIHLYARKYPSSDVITLLEVWGKNEYRPAVEILKLAKISKPKILDAGANVGYSMAYFKRFFADAEIICIEPDQSNLKQIKKNVELNNFIDVTLVEGALWIKRTKMELKNDYREGSSASLYVVESEKGSIEGFGIADILALQNWRHIDLLKIDVEGTEKYLLEQETTANAILQKTRLIAIEIHDEKADRAKIYKILALNNFTFSTKGETTIGKNMNFKIL